MSIILYYRAIMKKILSALCGPVLCTLFGVVVASSPVPVLATTPTALESLRAQVVTLERMITQRVQYPTVGARAVRSDDPEYFNVDVVSASPLMVFGDDDEDTLLVIATDGSVDQIALTRTCSVLNRQLTLLNNSGCATTTWILPTSEKDGVRQFAVPVGFVAGTRADTEQSLEIVACRFDGCRQESKATVVYRPERTYADEVVIKERYNWVYDWNNKTHAVQELLIGFPIKDIRAVRLQLLCEKRSAYIATTERDRLTCGSKRLLTRGDFSKPKTDKEGNVYNLRIEIVTNATVDASTTGINLRVDFLDMRNRYFSELQHKPIFNPQE